MDDKTTDPDGAETLAEQAYTIYRGMAAGRPLIAHWKDLDRITQGAFTWVARFAVLKEKR